MSFKNIHDIFLIAKRNKKKVTSCEFEIKTIAIV